MNKPRIAVVGGAGHIGLPLAARLAEHEPVYVLDTNKAATKQIWMTRTAPFMEAGLDDLLDGVIAARKLQLATGVDDIRGCRVIIVTVGTPVDAYLQPRLDAMFSFLKEFLPNIATPNVMRNSPLKLIIRSTLPVGGFKRVFEYANQIRPGTAVAYCPERATQGNTLEDMAALPQIVSGSSAHAVSAAADLFSTIAPAIIELTPEEAEYAKLFTNTYRYLQFGLVNEMYRMATSSGCDYRRIEAAMTLYYPRLADMPGPGFAAGPCLRKDALLLKAGHPESDFVKAGFWANEGLPNFVVDHLSASGTLHPGADVGVLGVAFKAENDDIRDSLACRLVNLLRHRVRSVRVHDPYVKHKFDAATELLVPMKEIKENIDVAIIATPHVMYRDLELPPHVRIFDMWGIRPSEPVPK